MSMSDRIAVFNLGRIEQIGPPAELYEQPQTRFVATFVGTSNLLEGDAAAALTGSPTAFAVRPEKIRLADESAEAGSDMCVADGYVQEFLYLGMHTRYLVKLDSGAEMTVARQNEQVAAEQGVWRPGDRVRLVWPQSANNPLQG